MLNIDAKDLHTQVEDDKFAGVEISKISDVWCLGPAGAVCHLSRFLQAPEINPHATLFALFLNAVPETMTQGEDAADAKTNMLKVMEFIPFAMRPGSPNDPRFLVLMEARSLFRDNDKYFDRYMKNHKFKNVEAFFKVAMKDCHTIIEKWPLRLKNDPSGKRAKEELQLLLASGHMGMERYVEWKRMA